MNRFSLTVLLWLFSTAAFATEGNVRDIFLCKDTDSGFTYNCDTDDLVPTGGTTDQVMAKASNDDYDSKWVHPIGRHIDLDITAYDMDSTAFFDLGTAEIVTEATGTEIANTGFNFPFDPSNPNGTTYLLIVFQSTGEDGDATQDLRISTVDVNNPNNGLLFDRMVAGVTNMSGVTWRRTPNSPTNAIILFNSEGGVDYKVDDTSVANNIHLFDAPGSFGSNIFAQTYALRLLSLSDDETGQNVAQLLFDNPDLAAGSSSLSIFQLGATPVGSFLPQANGQLVLVNEGGTDGISFWRTNGATVNGWTEALWRDDADGLYLSLSGGTMTGDIDMGGNSLKATSTDDITIESTGTGDVNIKTTQNSTGIEINTSGGGSGININTGGSSSTLALRTNGSNAALNLETQGASADIQIKSRQGSVTLITDVDEVVFDSDGTDTQVGNDNQTLDILGTSVDIRGVEIDPTGASTNQVLGYNGTKFLPVDDAGEDPAGADTQIQFNDGGVFGADAKHTWIDATARLVVGDGTGTNMTAGVILVNRGGITPAGAAFPTNRDAIRVKGTGTMRADIGLDSRSDNQGIAGMVQFRRSRESDDGLVQDGDLLGGVDFDGHDGTKFITTATIESRVDGTAAVDDMPSRLNFLTTPSGGNSPTTRFSIRENGDLAAGKFGWDADNRHLSVGDYSDSSTAGIAVRKSGDGSIPSDTAFYAMGAATTGAALTLDMSTDNDSFSPQIKLRRMAFGDEIAETDQALGIIGFFSGTGLTTTSYLTAATVAGGGTGYAVDDVLTIAGGTTVMNRPPATVVVTAESAGVITGVALADAGGFDNTMALPSSPNSVTGGSGTGASITVSFTAGGSDFDRTAYIQAKMLDGYTSPLSLPTRLEFYTTPAGSTTPVERVRIDEAGNFGIGATSLRATLHVNGGRITGRETYDCDSSPITITGDAEIIAVTTLTAACELNIPNNLVTEGRVFTFKDEVGTAGVNIVTIQAQLLTITGVTDDSPLAEFTTNAVHNLSVGHKLVQDCDTIGSYDGTFIVSAVPTTTTYQLTGLNFDTSSDTCTAQVPIDGNTSVLINANYGVGRMYASDAQLFIR